MKITKYFDGNITEKCKIDPSDFLDCETEEEFEEAVYDYIYSESEGDWGDVDCNEVYENELDAIPDELIEEWKRLKHFSTAL